MKTYIVTAQVFVYLTVEAESEEQARKFATTLKRYSMTSPDGEQIDIDDQEIVRIEEAE
jgi:hypothetical protein